MDYNTPILRRMKRRQDMYRNFLYFERRIKWAKEQGVSVVWCSGLPDLSAEKHLADLGITVETKGLETRLSRIKLDG